MAKDLVPHDASVKWDNLWESEEAREAVIDWLQHPGYAYFQRRCRIAEVHQLRLAISTSNERDAGEFTGMVRIRRLAELMASEARIKDPDSGGLVVPDTDPDELHAALLLFLQNWESDQ